MRVRSVRADQDAGPKSSVRGLALLVASLLATASVATARAAQVTFPKDNPKVTMEVPDGWDVTYNAFGLQIVSPEKDLVILADLLPRKKAEADGWAVKAEDKLGAFGISFDPDRAAKSRAAKDVSAPKTPAVVEPTPVQTPAVAAPKPAASDDKAPATAVGATTSPASPPSPTPAASPQVATSSSAPAPSAPPPSMVSSSTVTPGTPMPSPAPSSPSSAAPSSVASISSGPSIATGPVDRSAPTFTFINPPTKIEEPPPPAPPPAAAYFGEPSLDTPNKPVAPTAVRTDAPVFTLEKIDRLSNDRPKIPFAAGRLPSATMNGQPVDVQIVNFSISKSQLFLMIQASGPTDNRAVAILVSVKPAG